MKKIILIFFSITIFITASTSREEYENKVSYYEEAIQSASDGYGMSQAVMKYNSFLTKDIEATYKYLLSKLNSRKNLKNSFIATQEEWEKLRDKEFQMIELSFKDSTGSITGFAITTNKNMVLKDRLDYLTYLIPVEGDVGTIF